MLENSGKLFEKALSSFSHDAHCQGRGKEPKLKESKELELIHVVPLPMTFCSGHCVLPSAAILQPHSLSSVEPSLTGRSELSTPPFPMPMDKLEACESWAFWSSGPKCLQLQFPRRTNRNLLIQFLAVLELFIPYLLQEAERTLIF